MVHLTSSLTKHSYILKLQPSTNVNITVLFRSNPSPIKIQSNSAVKYPQFSNRIQFFKHQYMMRFIRGT
jgi:hypothetical protein